MSPAPENAIPRAGPRRERAPLLAVSSVALLCSVLLLCASACSVLRPGRSGGGGPEPVRGDQPAPTAPSPGAAPGPSGAAPGQGSPAHPPASGTSAPSGDAAAPPASASSPSQATSPSATSPRSPTSPQAPASPSAAESAEAPAPGVTVELSDAERERLSRAIEDDLNETTSLLRRIDRSALDDEGRDRLDAIQRLVETTREAMAENDLQSAATLSRKARLLAGELAGR
jgi:hypothetical protein